MSTQQIVADINNVRQLIKTFKRTAQDKVSTRSDQIANLPGYDLAEWQAHDEQAFSAFASLQAAEERLIEAMAHVIEAGNFVHSLEQPE